MRILTLPMLTITIALAVSGCSGDGDAAGAPADGKIQILEPLEGQIVETHSVRFEVAVDPGADAAARRPCVTSSGDSR